MRNIRNDRIFITRVAYEYRFGCLSEKVDNWCAAQTKCPFGNADLQALLPVPPLKWRYTENDFGNVVETSRERIQTFQVQEKEFFWKAEVFLQQAIA